MNCALVWASWGLQPVVPVYLNTFGTGMISVTEQCPVTGTNQLASPRKRVYFLCCQSCLAHVLSSSITRPSPLTSHTLSPLTSVSDPSLVVVHHYVEWAAAVTPQTPAELWKLYHRSGSITWWPQITLEQNPLRFSPFSCFQVES